VALNQNNILSINGGSSSIKFSLYRVDSIFKPVFYGVIENISTDHAILHFLNSITGQKTDVQIGKVDYISTVDYLIGWLGKQDDFNSVKAIGHRMVFGMNHTEPGMITPALLDKLTEWTVYDTEHMKGAIQLIKGFNKKFPQLPQIACFDTSFHADMPAVAKLLPIPRRYFDKGIRRYGFHGLSYAYLFEEYKRLSKKDSKQDRIVIAHLGNGASLAAIKDGKSIDTSMGFTPSGGIPMSTRSGDLDPGVLSYLMQTEKLNSTHLGHMFNYESGLLGISETSSDMRELMKSKSTDPRAAEAIDVFCYQVKKWIGSFIAALGGLNTLIFSGGIGENSPAVRSQICRDLQFLGIELDEVKNSNNEIVISTVTSRVAVYVIKTNEELMIARLTHQVMSFEKTK